MTSTPQERRTLSILPTRYSHLARTISSVGPCQAMRTVDLLDIAKQFPTLGDLVEDIADWDIQDGSIAGGLAVTILPGTTLHLVIQYRTSLTSSREFGDATIPHRRYQHVASAVRTGIVTACSHGPLGVVIVRLKPEAAARVLGEHIYEFADTKIDLGAVFGAGVVASLAEMLAESRSSHGRIVAVSKFLLRNIRAREPDPVVSRAAASLRTNPILRLGPLAANLGVSKRHLSRRFKAVFGMGPKRFALCARVEHALAAYDRESSWASIAHSCGFTDQAHMINDFKAILGSTPARVFRSLSTGEYCGWRMARPPSPLL
jgi:AraC-like DNA-binding protein